MHLAWVKATEGICGLKGLTQLAEPFSSALRDHWDGIHYDTKRASQSFYFVHIKRDLKVPQKWLEKPLAIPRPW